MASKKASAARNACEPVLASLRQAGADRSQLAPTTAIYDRLLARATELTDAFDEVDQKLSVHPSGMEDFLKSAVEIAAYWDREANTAARAVRTQLVEINRKIALAATELGSLLKQRSELSEGSGFTSGTYRSIRNVLDAAGEGNADYQMHLRKQFRQLRAAFRSKYWPTLEAIMNELAADAERADVQASDSITAAATEGQRPSKADYFRAWLTDMEEKGDGNVLPVDFKLSDAALASLGNCILDPPQAEIIDAGYVKGVRQKMRRR